MKNLAITATVSIALAGCGGGSGGSGGGGGGTVAPNAFDGASNAIGLLTVTDDQDGTNSSFGGTFFRYSQAVSVGRAVDSTDGRAFLQSTTGQDTGCVVTVLDDLFSESSEAANALETLGSDSTSLAAGNSITLTSGGGVVGTAPIFDLSAFGGGLAIPGFDEFNIITYTGELDGITIPAESFLNVPGSAEFPAISAIPVPVVEPLIVSSPTTGGIANDRTFMWEPESTARGARIEFSATDEGFNNQLLCYFNDSAGSATLTGLGDFTAAGGLLSRIRSTAVGAANGAVVVKSQRQRTIGDISFGFGG